MSCTYSLLLMTSDTIDIFQKSMCRLFWMPPISSFPYNVLLNLCRIGLSSFVWEEFLFSHFWANFHFWVKLYFSCCSRDQHPETNSTCLVIRQHVSRIVIHIIGKRNKLSLTLTLVTIREPTYWCVLSCLTHRTSKWAGAQLIVCLPEWHSSVVVCVVLGHCILYDVAGSYDLGILTAQVVGIVIPFVRMRTVKRTVLQKSGVIDSGLWYQRAPALR